jgi:hypothetical protein
MVEDYSGSPAGLYDGGGPAAEGTHAAGPRRNDPQSLFSRMHVVCDDDPVYCFSRKLHPVSPYF